MGGFCRFSDSTTDEMMFMIGVMGFTSEISTNDQLVVSWDSDKTLYGNLFFFLDVGVYSISREICF